MLKNLLVIGALLGKLAVVGLAPQPAVVDEADCPIARRRGASRAIAIAENPDREKYVDRDVNHFNNNGADFYEIFLPHCGNLVASCGKKGSSSSGRTLDVTP